MANKPEKELPKRITLKQYGSGFKCPFCGGKNFNKSESNADGADAWNVLECGDCGGGWSEGYKLDHVDVDKWPEGYTEIKVQC